MSEAECRQALERGRDLIDRLVPSGGNTVLLGEMGIGNTAAAALLMHGLAQFPRSPIAWAGARDSTMRAWSASAPCSPQHSGAGRRRRIRSNCSRNSAVTRSRCWWER